MNSRTARTALTTVGVIAVVVGAIWVGQGLNLIPGSFMSGDTTWLVIGAIVAVVGVVLFILGQRRLRGTRPGE